MKLDYENVRTILLTLEENMSWTVENEGGAVYISKNPLMLKKRLCELIPDIPFEEIAYISLRLEEAGFINIKVHYAFSDSTISDIEYLDITFEGHDYLNSIRDPNVWEKVKPFVKDMAVETAKQVISTLFIKMLTL